MVVNLVVMGLNEGVGYYTYWYQHFSFNNKPIWAKDQHEFDKFVVGDFYFALNLGKMIKSK
jgi:hypothetical protein